MRLTRRNKAGTILSVMILLLAAVMSASGEQTWDCPECGKTGNKKNFCGVCGHPAPWKEESRNRSSGADLIVGSVVKFGRYEQDNDASNGPEEIEWLVLDVDSDAKKALLLSRYGLDAKPYNEKYVDITWEKCTLRTWLNGIFLNKAFTAAEQKGILLTKVDNGSSQGYSKWGTSGGNNTEDRVFLLSYAEANKYLGVTYVDSKNTKSRVAPTAYAIKQGANTSSGSKTADGTAAGWWWLRSPGSIQGDAASVGPGGSLNDRNVSNDSAVVRPALWINLESDIF